LSFFWKHLTFLFQNYDIVSGFLRVAYYSDSEYGVALKYYSCFGLVLAVDSRFVWVWAWPIVVSMYKSLLWISMGE